MLTGGASTRMGTDKALLEVGGASMAARVVDALLAAGASDAFCVGGDLVGLRALGLTAIPDDHPGEGPLGGIITALGAAAADVVLVAPCDLVAPDATVLAAIVDALGGALVALPVVDGNRQPLNAAFRTAVLTELRAAFEAGARSVRRTLAELDGVVEVPVAAGPLADADAPEDLPTDR